MHFSGDLLVNTFIIQSMIVIYMTAHSVLILLNLLKEEEAMTKVATATLNIGKFIILKETQGHAIYSTL